MRQREKLNRCLNRRNRAACFAVQDRDAHFCGMPAMQSVHGNCHRPVNVFCLRLIALAVLEDFFAHELAKCCHALGMAQLFRIGEEDRNLA